jgi:hypothetical protein
MSLFGRIMVFPLFVVFGFITKPPTMIRLFAELLGHYQSDTDIPVANVDPK